MLGQTLMMDNQTLGVLASIVSTIFTPLGFLMMVFQWLYPRQPQGSATMPNAATGLRRPIPKSSFIWGILALASMCVGIATPFRLQVSGPQGPAGPPGPISNDPRMEVLIQRVSTLETKVASLSSLLQSAVRFEALQTCLLQTREKISPDDKIEGLIKSAEDEIAYPEKYTASPAYRVFGNPIAQWNKEMNMITSLTFRCYPDLEANFRIDLTSEQLEAKVEGEPQGTDYDQKRRYRRFFYQSNKVRSLLLQLKIRLAKDIEEIGSTLVSAKP